MECFVVYSDIRHCPNINAWFGPARPVMEKLTAGRPPALFLATLADAARRRLNAPTPDKERTRALELAEKALRRMTEIAEPGLEAAAALLEQVAKTLVHKACALARLGRTDKAFGTREQALAAGFPVRMAEILPVLQPLHSDPRWNALLDRFRRPPAD